MKISKKTREQAALICALCASADSDAVEFGSVWRAMVDSERGDHESYGVAYRAWEHVFDSLAKSWHASPEESRAHYAEAESLLRTGWSP